MISSISFFEKKRKICSYFSKTVLKETADIRKIKIYYSFKTVSQDILRFKIGEKTEFDLTSFWRAEFYLTSFWRAVFYLTSFWRTEFYLTSFWKGNLEMIPIFRLNSFIFAILKNFLKYLALVFLRAEISSECVSVGINTEILTNLQALGRDKAWNHYWNSEKSGKVFSHLQNTGFL